MVDRGGDIGTPGLPPDRVGPGHISTPAGPDCQGSVSATDRVDDPVVGDDAGTDIAVDSIGPPKLLAVIRRDSQQVVLDADDQFAAGTRFDNQRRVP